VVERDRDKMSEWGGHNLVVVVVDVMFCSSWLTPVADRVCAALCRHDRSPSFSSLLSFANKTPQSSVVVVYGKRRRQRPGTDVAWLGDTRNYRPAATLNDERSLTGLRSTRRCTLLAPARPGPARHPSYYTSRCVWRHSAPAVHAGNHQVYVC